MVLDEGSKELVLFLGPLLCGRVVFQQVDGLVLEEDDLLMREEPREELPVFGIQFFDPGVVNLQVAHHYPYEDP